MGHPEHENCRVLLNILSRSNLSPISPTDTVPVCWHARTKGRRSSSQSHGSGSVMHWWKEEGVKKMSGAEGVCLGPIKAEEQFAEMGEAFMRRQA